MDERVLKAALAGLLHDVGKIAQRALVEPRKAAPGFEGEGQPAHATYSAYFVQSYVPPAYRAAALAGAYHHHPERSPAEDKFLSKLTALADKLSAGERADQPEAAKKPPRQGLSIFDRVSLAQRNLQAGIRNYLPLKKLALQREVIFPVPGSDGQMEGEGYQALLDGLSAAVRKDPGDLQTYVEQTLAALQEYAWCVPSAYYYSMPDVSLYDHSRMTAALAACMAEFDETQIDTLLASVQAAFTGKAEMADTPVALLVGGDLSGIQKFIYTIASKQAGKTLRGRSFHLQLLTEAVLQFTLRELGLPVTNVIYSGGGHFFLLAPVSAAERLPGLRRQVTEKLLAHHGTSLYFALGSAIVPASGFKAGVFPKYWSEMHASLERAKHSRYTELGAALYKQVFTVPEYGGNPEDTCSVCGEDLRSTTKFTDYDEIQARICGLCSSFAELGSDLQNADLAILGWHDPVTTEPGGYGDALRTFGMELQIPKQGQPIMPGGAQRLTLWALDDGGTEALPDTGGLPAVRRLRYTVNAVPDMTFDELQQEAEGGFKRLGVLRMDVDSLGEVFKRGLGKHATLARLSSLSFLLSLFFEGWVKRICEAEPFNGKIYAVYAGGDDVFLTGPWDRMPELALKICNDFHDYTGGNPDLHLSAGMSFIDGKYPLRQAAEDSERELQKAKHLDGKQAFGFLGEVWKWNVFEELRGKSARIGHFVKEMGGPRQIIQLLRELAGERAGAAKERAGKPVWGAWQWRGAYQLKRMAEREKSRPDLVREIEAIHAELDRDNFSELDQWGAAARWAQLITRKEGGQE